MELIDKQAVLELISNPYQYTEIKQWLDAVPIIQQDTDCISRQDAIDALNEYFVRIGRLKRRGLTRGEKAIRLDAVGAIKTLPSVQPERKRGKWVRSITKDLIGYNITVYTCTECAQISMCISNFCPNCGANMMEGEQNG